MSDTLQAVSVGSLALRALSDQDHNFVGVVTHTFPTSFYIRTPRDSLIFVTERQLQSPVTVNVDATAIIEQLVRPGDKLYTEGSEFRAEERVRIDLNRAKVYNAPILSQKSWTNSQVRALEQSLRLVAFILQIIDTSRSMLDQCGLAHSKVVKFVQSELASLASGNHHGLQVASMELIGSGYGFTPSGDDFLGGFLAVYNSLAMSTGRLPILLEPTEVRKRTPWHSAILLDYMQHLILDEQISEIISSVLQAHSDRLVEAIETLVSRGHTSGIDMSSGILFAMGVFLDSLFRKTNTEKVAKSLGLL